MIASSVLIPTILLFVGSSNAAFLPGRSIATNIGIISSGGSSGVSSGSSSSSSSSSSSQLFQTLPSIDSMKDQLSNLSDKLTSTNSSNSINNPISYNTSPPFNVNDPEALIAITKSFIATDFGIQSMQLPDYSTAPKTKDADIVSGGPSSSTPLSALAAASAASSSSSSSNSAPSSSTATAGLPFYSSSLLADSMIWVSGNNLDDAGVLTKEEYLAAGRYFDLRKSFPDLEYRAHHFRIIRDEETGGGGRKATTTTTGGGEEITVRFTTATTGTFRGGPLRLRSSAPEPNGGAMRCPPASVSITYSTSAGPNLGKITKLVTDAVLDRRIGNTNGLSGVPAAAYVGGAPPNALTDGGGVPPFAALTRLFGRPAATAGGGSGSGGGGDDSPSGGASASALPPFPPSVMIQLAKGVTASNFGLDDANLLAEEFEYVEPSLGPLGKKEYAEVFGVGGEFSVREGVADLDYGLENFRVDPYDPYRVWVDSRATGTRTGSIGPRSLPPDVASLPYAAPPEAISFSFDDDGFCTRLTAAAVLDPLLGNTGGLGGVYGLLYATGTPVNVLKTRSLNGILSRVTKGLLSSVTGVGADGWKLSDGRVVNGLSPTESTATESPVRNLPSSTQTASPPKSLPPGTALTSAATESTTATASKPFFAADLSPTPPKIAPPKVAAAAKAASVTTPKPPVAPILPRTSKSTEQSAPSATTTSSTGSKAQQLRNAAQAARAEAADAKEKANAKKAQEQAARQAAIDAKLDAQRRAEELRKEALLSKEKDAAAKKEERERAAEVKRQAAAVEVEVAAKKKQTKQAGSSVASSDGNASNAGNNGGGMFSFLSGGNAPEKPPMAESIKKSPAAKPAPPAKRSPTISLFDSFKTASSTSAEKTTKLQPSSKNVSAAPKAVAKGTSSPVVKRSPTISLFGTNSATPKKPSKASSSKDTKTKNKTTASVFGIGGATRSKKKTKTTKTKVAASEKATPRKKSPTLNIFGMGGASSSSTKQSKQVTSKKSTTSKPKSAPFFANKKATVAPAPAPAPIKRSPTISLFNTQPSKKKPSATAANANKSNPKEAATKKIPFNLFGGGTGAVAPTKKQPPTQPPSSSSPAKKSGGNANPFSFFGGLGNSVGGNSEEKENNKSSSATKMSKTAQKKKKQPVKRSVVAPKGVPVLKRWKPVKGNSIEGRIYGSNSFKDGVSVTTSSIKGKEGSTKFFKGSVVQTKSGSKYFLD